ncbi:MAG: radical SAM protein [Methanomicrobiales archaeon]|nr:radical SAM protein [Methanomicrobiales archaeon]
MIQHKTQSICPVCLKVVNSEIVERDKQIFIERSCPEHGHFSNLYWSDAELYHRFAQYHYEGRGLENPQVSNPQVSCPGACGICANHKSTTLLANIDLTNRCNLNCDFCFANARVCGFVYEPTFEEVDQMLTLLRSEKPNPTPAVQFAGGEPTLREDLPDLVRLAKRKGFLQVQIATNGILLAKDPNLAQVLKDAGVSTVYLHFDGVSKKTNFKLKRDLQAIENCKAIGLGMVLVPTIIGGFNDHEIGEMIRFAADNISVIRGLNFQPVSFTGAKEIKEMEKERITIPDLLQRIENQTGGSLKVSDFYPVPCVVPISDFVEMYTNKPQIRFTAHEHCGAATYGFVTEQGLTPVTKIIDVDEFFKAVQNLTDKLGEKGPKLLHKFAAISGVRDLHKAATATTRSDEFSKEFWSSIGKALISHNFDSLREFHWNALFIGTMHFMDNYNYDIERVQQCCIHYATPDGKLIPFCTYNSGPVYREKVWRNHQRNDLKQVEIEEI